MIIAAQIFAASLSHSTLYNCILVLANEQPHTRFIVMANNELSKPENLAENIEWVQLKATPKTALLLQYWQRFTLSALLKKVHATHFISEMGTLGLSLHIPQYMLLNNIYILQKKHILSFKNASILKKFFPKFLQKADGIFITEKFIGETIVNKFPSAESKINFIGHGLESVYRPIEWEQKDVFLETFSYGTEYFIAEANVLTQANILSLLKAFSLFKKRQKSGMKLALLLKGLTIEDCIKDFRLYKYREDVTLIPYTTETAYAEILSAAYAAIYLPVQVVAENTGLHALACGTPLITFQNAAAAGIYSDAALYAELSEKSIAEQMMELYKDEALRKQLIEKGLNISAAYNWPTTATALWQAIGSPSVIKH